MENMIELPDGGYDLERYVHVFNGDRIETPENRSDSLVQPEIQEVQN